MDLHDIAELHSIWRMTRTPGETAAGSLEHLKEEVVELLLKPELEEAADVLLCLLSWVELSGNTVDQLLEEAEVKISVNQSRRWEKGPSGTWRHV